PTRGVGERREARRGEGALRGGGPALGGCFPGGAPPETRVVASEPVWAIGTGLTPTAGDVAEMHGFIRRRLTSRFAAAGQGMRILYGGLGKASNARGFMGLWGVDGAVGGGGGLKGEEVLANFWGYRREGGVEERTRER